MEKIKFDQRNPELFNLIKERVEDYFRRNQISRYADNAMLIKIFVWLSLWVGTVALLPFLRQNPALLFLIGLLHMFTHLMIAFNIAHDANHGALFKSKKLKDLFSYAIDILGCNSKLWQFSHNMQHHTYVNVHGQDNNIEGYSILRFCPEAPHRRFHKYQQYYAFGIYCLSTINYIISRDFKLLKQYVSIHGSRDVRTAGFVFKFVFFKLFYFFYTLVLPIAVFHLPASIVLSYFLAGHFINGFLLSIIFQTGHLTDETYFPEVKDHQIDKNWCLHIVETTGDYARSKPYMHWLFGAINIHVTHHLFPKICHTHYPKLAPIIKATVEECGYKYIEFETFGHAIRAHYNELKYLGKGPDAVAHHEGMLAEMSVSVTDRKIIREASL